MQHGLGVPGAADRAYGIADRLLSLSGDRSLAGYVTAYRAEVAKDRSDLRAAVTHFERAQAMLGRSAPPMVLAWTSAVGAEVMALSGRASEMTVGLARVSLAEGDAAQAQRHCLDALDGFARVRSARGFRLVQVIRGRISAVGGIASVRDLDVVCGSC